MCAHRTQTRTGVLVCLWRMRQKAQVRLDNSLKSNYIPLYFSKRITGWVIHNHILLQQLETLSSYVPIVSILSFSTYLSVAFYFSTSFNPLDTGCLLENHSFTKKPFTLPFLVIPSNKHPSRSLSISPSLPLFLSRFSSLALCSRASSAIWVPGLKEIEM